MTAAYGTLSRVAYGSRANTATAVPASTATGNLLILIVVTALATTAPSATLPAQFTQIGTEMVAVDSGNFQTRTKIGYRLVAGGDPTTYTCTHTTCGCETLMIRITGSGTLAVDASSQAAHNSADNSSAPTVIIAPSCSPTVANALLLYNVLNWDTLALTPPTGMTEVQDAQFCYFAWQVLSASGATGTRSNGPSNVNPWFASLVAISDTAGGGGSGKPVKVWSGSAWVTKSLKVWSGSAWVVKPAKVWNGSAWV